MLNWDDLMCIGRDEFKLSDEEAAKTVGRLFWAARDAIERQELIGLVLSRIGAYRLTADNGLERVR